MSNTKLSGSMYVQVDNSVKKTSYSLDLDTGINRGFQLIYSRKSLDSADLRDGRGS